MIAPLVDGDRCPGLRGKLKLFLVQACRGSAVNRTDTDGGAAVGRTLPAVYAASRAKVKQQAEAVVKEGDYIVFSSTVPGYVSFRNTQHGSWFIQVNVLRIAY